MGSFVKKDDILRSISDKNERKALSNLKDTVTGPTQEQAKEAQAASISDVITKQLPETVVTAYGELDYELFKERFADVYTQVNDKLNLVTGRVTCEFKIGQLRCVLRSLKNKERTALISFAGNPKTDNLLKFSQDDAEYRKRLLALSIESFDGAKFPSITFSETGEINWTNLASSLRFIEDMDEALVSLLYSMSIDLSTAKQLALIENLKNP